MRELGLAVALQSASIDTVTKTEDVERFREWR